MPYYADPPQISNSRVQAVKSGSQAVQIGFNDALPYSFVLGSATSVNQIFKYVPMGVANALSLNTTDVFATYIVDFQPLDSAMVQIWIPRGSVRRFRHLVTNSTSALYTQDDNTVRGLLANVNPNLPFIPGEGGTESAVSVMGTHLYADDSNDYGYFDSDGDFVHGDEGSSGNGSGGGSGNGGNGNDNDNGNGSGNGNGNGGDSGNSNDQDDNGTAGANNTGAGSASTAGIALGASGGAALYAVAMVFAFRKYRKHHAAAAAGAAGANGNGPDNENMQQVGGTSAYHDTENAAAYGGAHGLDDGLGSEGGVYSFYGPSTGSPSTRHVSQALSTGSEAAANAQRVHGTAISAPLAAENSLGWH